MRPFRSLASLLPVLSLLFVSAYSAPTLSQRLTGSGASFPFPIYSTWFKTYSRANPGVIIDYQAKGSGAGIRDFINQTVDFAASDAAMTDEEMVSVAAGVQLLPVTAGKIVLAYNLPGVPPLRLPRDVYPLLFTGGITRWDDDRLQAANPDITLPDMPITIVRRADSSGTTFAFTRHLEAVSDAWAEAHGSGKTVVWPDSDKIVAAPKNDGVTATIKQTPGSLGYVEYGYARFAKLPMAALENASGRFVAPSLAGGVAALAGTPLPPDMRVWITDPQGADAYPIITYTWLLLYREYADAEIAAALKAVVEYCLSEGQLVADRLGYVPLPEPVVTAVRRALGNVR
jgi:phosphate transport system substrate-binding protein